MSTELQTVQHRSKATPRQEANRKNAQKSTGPRTIEGKEASSQNAIKHGLCANRNVIRTESQEQYDNFRDEMIDDISPAGAMELMLAERIVSLSWRLKRAEHFQNAAMNAMIERDLNDSGYGWHDRVRRQARDEAAEGNFDLVLGITVNIDFSRNKVLENLLAYEHRIESRLYRAITELKKMQAIRREQEKRNEKSIETKDEARVMMDEEMQVTDEGRKMMGEGIHVTDGRRETMDEEVSLNEPNLNENSEFRSQEEDYEIKQLCDLGDPGGESAKRSQFDNDLVCTAQPAAFSI